MLQGGSVLYPCLTETTPGCCRSYLPPSQPVIRYALLWKTEHQASKERAAGLASAEASDLACKQEMSPKMSLEMLLRCLSCQRAAASSGYRCSCCDPEPTGKPLPLRFLFAQAHAVHRVLSDVWCVPGPSAPCVVYVFLLWQNEKGLWKKVASYLGDARRWMHGRIAALATLDLVVVRTAELLLPKGERELVLQLHLALDGPDLLSRRANGSSRPGLPQRRSSKLPWLKTWEGYPGYAQYSWSDYLLEAGARALKQSFPRWEDTLTLLACLLHKQSTQHSLVEHLQGTFSWQIVRFAARAGRREPSAVEERNILRSFVRLAVRAWESPVAVTTSWGGSL